MKVSELIGEGSMMRKQIRVGLPTIINGKVGVVSPIPGTGNVHPNDWANYKEPVWEFIPVKRVDDWEDVILW